MRSNHDVLSTLPRDDRLAGRTAWVTGSTSGIGEAVAHVLAASGATVLVSGGRRGLQVELSPADLVALTRATTADVGR
ncbi:hypothetical protein GCM10023162_40010 [Klenkia terrae]